MLIALVFAMTASAAMAAPDGAADPAVPTCSTGSPVLFGGQWFCPGYVVDIKQTAYGVGTAIVLNGVTVLGVSGPNVTVSGGPSCLNPDTYCGAIIPSVSVSMAVLPARPAYGDVIDVYGTTAIGTLNATGYVVKPRVISLSARANNKYVTAENAGSSPLIASRTTVGGWEQFDLIPLDPGNVALRAHANNLYVTAENAGKSPLIANRTTVGLSETFQLVHNADGTVSLRARVNARYVVAENGGASPLIASGKSIGTSAKYLLIGGSGYCDPDFC